MSDVMIPSSALLEDVFKLKYHQQNKCFNATDDLVVLTFDDNYMDQSINLMLSLIRNNKKSISFICLCLDLSSDNVETLLKMDIGIQVKLYDLSVEINTGRWSRSALLRLFTPWLLDESIAKILYMDSDIICCGNIRELFDMDVSYVAMGNEISGNVSETQQKTYRKLFPTQIYCNSGVVLINLVKIRTEFSFQDMLMQCVDICSKYPYPDQDFLNIFFDGKIQYFNGLCYNFQVYELINSCKYKNALKLCKLIHFSCGKPWNPKTDRRIIKLYLTHTEHFAMKSRIKKVLRKNLFVGSLHRILTKLKAVKSLLRKT